MNKLPIIRDRQVIAYIHFEHPLGVRELPNGDYEVYFKEAF